MKIQFNVNFPLDKWSFYYTFVIKMIIFWGIMLTLSFPFYEKNKEHFLKSKVYFICRVSLLHSTFILNGLYIQRMSMYTLPSNHIKNENESGIWLCKINYLIVFGFFFVKRYLSLETKTNFVLYLSILRL